MAQPQVVPVQTPEGLIVRISGEAGVADLPNVLTIAGPVCHDTDVEPWGWWMGGGVADRPHLPRSGSWAAPGPQIQVLPDVVGVDHSCRRAASGRLCRISLRGPCGPDA